MSKKSKIGIEKYIEQQLNPASLNDSVADSKIKNLEILNMETSEIFAKYPNPGALLRMLEGNNGGQNRNNAAMDEKSEQESARPNTRTSAKTCQTLSGIRSASGKSDRQRSIGFASSSRRLFRKTT